MEKRLLTGILCLVLSIALLPANVVMGQAGSNIAGTVQGQKGDPKQFVSVQLDGPRRYVATTDAQGAFTLSAVVPGYYTVRVRQGDYVETFSKQIQAGPLALVVKW